METKRSNKSIQKLAANDTFKIKQSGGATFIEGFANKATVDRGDEIIDPNAWELDNFKKNPIILFNHGFDTLGGLPVGRATQVKPTEEGLFLKVRLSNSEAPGIKMVRDLVEERILQAFSVGFDPKETAKEQHGEGENKRDITRITKAELFEVSIVGVPMNQDSIFTVSEKSLTTKSLYEIKKDVLKQKGADYAEQVHELIYSKSDDAQDRFNIIEMIAEAASMTVEEVKDVLAGNTEPTDDFKAAVDAIFKGDMEEDKEDDDEDDKEHHDDEEDDEDKDEKQNDDDKSGDNGEESKDKGDENSKEDGEKERDEKQDFQDCVSGKIPKLIDEGMEQDQAVAVAISQCQESGKCSLSPESKSDVYAACFQVIDNFNETGEWNFETFSTDSIVISSTESESTKQAEQEGENSNTTAIATQPGEDEFGSPFLEQQKQTNVLLGSLISATQQLISAVAQLTAQQDQSSSDDTGSQETTGSADNQGVDEKTIAKAQKSLENLNKRLNNLGY